MRLDHVGFITSEIKKFEEFWCEILGYRCFHQSKLTKDMAMLLFETDEEAEIRRYRAVCVEGPDIEIHVFKNGPKHPDWHLFQSYGINHVCLHTGGPESRRTLLERLPERVEVRVFNNPKGWQNVFIRDFEGNWVELRCDLKRVLE